MRVSTCRGRVVEKGGVYLPSQLERTLNSFVGVEAIFESVCTSVHIKLKVSLQYRKYTDDLTSRSSAIFFVQHIHTCVLHFHQTFLAILCLSGPSIADCPGAELLDVIETKV